VANNLFLEAAFTIAAAPTDAAFCKMFMRSCREVSYTVTDG
jgi:hypothetical protein